MLYYNSILLYLYYLKQYYKEYCAKKQIVFKTKTLAINHTHRKFLYIYIN